MTLAYRPELLRRLFDAAIAAALSERCLPNPTLTNVNDFRAIFTDGPPDA